MVHNVYFKAYPLKAKNFMASVVPNVEMFGKQTLNFWTTLDEIKMRRPAPEGPTKGQNKRQTFGERARELPSGQLP